MKIQAGYEVLFSDTVNKPVSLSLRYFISKYKREKEKKLEDRSNYTVRSSSGNKASTSSALSAVCFFPYFLSATCVGLWYAAGICVRSFYVIPECDVGLGRERECPE
jgi:hypothetical protein